MTGFAISPLLLRAISDDPPRDRARAALELLLARYGRATVVSLLGICPFTLWQWQHGCRNMARDSAARILDLAAMPPEHLEHLVQKRREWHLPAS